MTKGYHRSHPVLITPNRLAFPSVERASFPCNLDRDTRPRDVSFGRRITRGIIEMNFICVRDICAYVYVRRTILFASPLRASPSFMTRFSFDLARVWFKVIKSPA